MSVSQATRPSQWRVHSPLLLIYVGQHVSQQTLKTTSLWYLWMLERIRSLLVDEIGPILDLTLREKGEINLKLYLQHM